MRFRDDYGNDCVDGEDYDELKAELAEAKLEIAAYQLRVDNDALRIETLQAVVDHEYGPSSDQPEVYQA